MFKLSLVVRVSEFHMGHVEVTQIWEAAQSFEVAHTPGPVPGPSHKNLEIFEVGQRGYCFKRQGYGWRENGEFS
jgi:hypothetical protein